MAGARQKLLSAGTARICPSPNDKIPASWNALTLKAYVSENLALGVRQYLTDQNRLTAPFTF